MDYYPEDQGPEDFEEEEFEGCDFGAEFCVEPDTKAMGLCTTECRLYFEMVEAQEEAGA